MSNLLRADYVRLFKSAVFRFFIAVIIVYTLFSVIRNPYNFYSSPDRLIVTDIPSSIIAAIFITSFIGTDYHNGTIRNKLSIGYKKISVYFSNIIVCFTASAFLYLVRLIIIFCAGIPLIGNFSLSAEKNLTSVLVSLMLIFAYSSLYVLIAMLNINKAAGSVLAVLLSFAMLFASIIVSDRLKRPEYSSAEKYINGKHEWVIEKNPSYIGGAQRVLYLMLNDAIPDGQIMQLSADIERASRISALPFSDDETEEDAPINLFLLHSFFIITAASAGGILIFRKKDLK